MSILDTAITVLGAFLILRIVILEFVVRSQKRIISSLEFLVEEHRRGYALLTKDLDKVTDEKFDVERRAEVYERRANALEGAKRPEEGNW